MISSDTTDNRRTFDESRIAQFESDAIPQYRTVIRAIDMASIGVADVKALNDLMTAFGHQVEYFLQCFQRREYRRFCQGNRYFEWRNRLVLTQKAENAAAKAEGRAPQSIFPYNLQARQWKMALQAASDITERHFRLLQTTAMTRLRSRKVWKTLSKAEQHYVNGLFCGLSDLSSTFSTAKFQHQTRPSLKKAVFPGLGSSVICFWKFSGKSAAASRLTAKIVPFGSIRVVGR